MSIVNNIEVIRDRISSAASKAGSNPSEIIIVCVSKNRIIEEIYQALDAGIEYIGESKVQEAQTKYAALRDYVKDTDISLSFHMVGHLQTNKVNKALDMFDMIQSIDSFKLAQKINEAARDRNLNTDILIEVNTFGEESKFGVSSEQTINLLREICALDNVCVRGLMTMAPLLGLQEYARPYFRRLRELRDRINEIEEPLFREKINMDFLSMGMSQDYEVAVEEGANMLRIGTAIFE
ncbi:MAG: YggS family pyridoxal phosphate-dependent enzyme [Candidatus Omnitrophica bacterium]|nr:YggS family pyridoxal phosphate-dependent enzyme [Candidatus Omnitrophota bacterium]